MEVHVAVRRGVRLRVHHPDCVRHLHLLLQEADGRRHQVRRLRELRPTDSGSAVLELGGPRHYLHRIPGADHAVSGRSHGPRFGFDEAARYQVLPYLHVLALRGARSGLHHDLGLRVWRQIRSGRLPQRLPRHQHRCAQPRRAACIHREHQHVGIRRLQHADLLQLPEHHSAQPV